MNIERKSNVKSENRQKPHWLPITLVALALAFSALLIFDERNYYAITSTKGSVTSGSKFGVKIGEQYSRANEILKKEGFRFVDDVGGTYNYLDSGWRNGLVSLTVKNGQVTSVNWSYTLLDP